MLLLVQEVFQLKKTHNTIILHFSDCMIDETLKSAEITGRRSFMAGSYHNSLPNSKTIFCGRVNMAAKYSF